MKIIGITGGTGSGKTTLLDVIARRGGCVVDCDAVYHDLLTANPKMLQEISDRFPGTVAHGELNRKKLSAIVFHDKQALLDLNAITHRYVIEKTKAILQSSGARLGAIDAIALFESGLNRLCDVTVCVTAPEEARVLRLMQREQIPADRAKARIAAQRKDAEFSALCDFTLKNNTTKEEFTRQCYALLDIICKGEPL